MVGIDTDSICMNATGEAFLVKQFGESMEMYIAAYKKNHRIQIVPKLVEPKPFPQRELMRDDVSCHEFRIYFE